MKKLIIAPLVLCVVAMMLSQFFFDNTPVSLPLASETSITIPLSIAAVMLIYAVLYAVYLYFSVTLALTDNSEDLDSALGAFAVVAAPTMLVLLLIQPVVSLLGFHKIISLNNLGMLFLCLQTFLQIIFSIGIRKISTSLT